MKRVAVIGLFNNGQSVSDGQSVKTRILTEELEYALGMDDVVRIDTYGWKKNPFKLFWLTLTSTVKYKNVLFLTDEGGIKVFPILLQIANIAKRTKLHYYVVGGWLNQYLHNSKTSLKILKNIDAIYVELPSMYNELQNMGFSNVVLVNKFRRMDPVSEKEIELYPKESYKLCYFSRVMQEKGIEEAIDAVIQLNKKNEAQKYSLDIWGSINDPYKERFEELMKKVPSYIRYCGVVDFQQSTNTLKSYHAMLFPTYYKSEGYPNSIVDAFAAGLPVITTRWNYNADVVNDGDDGVFVDVGNVDQISSAIESLFEDPEKYKKMRINCLKRCEEYLPHNAVIKVIDQFK